MPPWIPLFLVDYVGTSSTSPRDTAVGAALACAVMATIRYAERRADKRVKSADMEMELQSKESGELRKQLIDENITLRREVKEARDTNFKLQYENSCLRSERDMLKGRLEGE